MAKKSYRIRVRELICILIASPALIFSQQTSKTTAPCSPITPYNRGVITIQCTVNSDKTGKQLIEILNRIEKSQLNLNLVMEKINEMERNLKEIREQQELSGSLLPANEPTPKTPCGKIPIGAMLILVGNSASFTDRFPHSVIQVKGEDILTLSKKDNELAVSVKIFGRDGRIVAEIKDNEFSINPSNYFRRERPDKSTLIVYDQEDRKVLDVRFINPSTVRFLGILNYPHSIRPLVISQTEGQFVGKMCAGYCLVDFVIE